MSEYVTVETRPTGDPNSLEIITNQRLTTAEREVYASYDEGDEGSPIAQMLFNGIDGIAALAITEHSLLITRDPDAPWEQLVDDVRDALRDFFL
ncbi:MAG: NifU N-terminal domain-containing protein [Anaerolineae bacterium]|nr:NifU N-terminal domain-containing protein [Anaerolineae bacterium]